MTSGTSVPGHPADSVSGGFDFDSDNIFCSYEDRDNQDGNNGIHFPHHPSTDSSSTKEFNKNRKGRPSAYSAAPYNPPEESSSNQVVISTVQNTMKKHTDNVMCFLEGINSRLSQLELYCYNLDKSIGETHSDLIRCHGESESKLKSLEKHVEEVHRSVQILRDRQELADAQKELAKLHLAKRESSSAVNSQGDDRDRAVTPTSEPKDSKNSSDSHNQQLAIVVPPQVTPQPCLHNQPQPQSLEHQQQPRPVLPPSMPAYYFTSPQMAMTNTVGATQTSQTQAQDHSRMSTPPGNYHLSQNSHVQPVSAYLQQWSQQPQQQLVVQPKIQNPSQGVCSSYLPNQSNQPPPAMTLNTISMQVPYPGASQPGFASPEATFYGYGAGGRSIQQQPSTQNVKTAYGAAAQPQPGNSYARSGPHPALHSGNAYLAYDGEGWGGHHPPPQVRFQQSGYPSSTIPPQKPQQVPPGTNMVAPHMVRSHPYGELIEKLVGMGYRSDHVVRIFQKLEESGQPIDFNAVLDRLNVHSAEGSQRGWSA